MKINLERDNLLKAISQAHAVSERRNTIPILANTLIDAAGEAVSFRATDLDVEIIVETGAEVERAGATTVNASMLHDIVRKLPAGAKVALDYDEKSGQMKVKAGRSLFDLATLPREDFPIMANAEYAVDFALKSETFFRLLTKTQFAMAIDETRYYLTGVYMHVGTNDADAGHCLRCVATDGHRLAQADTALPEGVDEAMPGVIVPRKTVGELRKLLEGEADANINVSVSKEKVRFKAEGVTLTSKVIDGKFPDYKRVIPLDNTRRMEIEAQDLLHVVDRVSVISTERSRGVKMLLETDRLVLSVNSPSIGHAEEEMAVIYQNEQFETGFNAKYLHDVIAQVENEKAIFLFDKAGDPVLVRDGEDNSVLYVIMPMRV